MAQGHLKLVVRRQLYLRNESSQSEPDRPTAYISLEELFLVAILRVLILMLPFL